mgnify:CR=1 FL=1
MCGIAGWVDWKKPPSKSVVTVMTGKLRHRGPDNGGILQMGEAVFGHRRLSILDLSAAANQPMTYKNCCMASCKQKSPQCRKEALLLRPFDPHHPAVERNLHTVKRFVIGRYTLFMVFLNMFEKKKRYKWGLILR